MRHDRYPDTTKHVLGICTGASTVSFVTLSGTAQPEIKDVLSLPHNANPKKAIQQFLAEHDTRFDSVVLTGRRFRHLIRAHSVSEPEAVEQAFHHLGYAGRYKAVASLGGETFLVYCFDDRGNIVNVLSGNKCASGTGEFFLQQIRRMGLGVAEATTIAENQIPHAVSGRCSVFCKSDCTHALNKGIPIATVVAGLCRMIANKIVELLAKQPSQNILVIGGVAQNKSVLRFIREHYESITIPDAAPWFEAFGAALIAFTREFPLDREHLFKEGVQSFSFLPPLSEGQSRVEFKTMPRGTVQDGDECILGLDVGSTTTKAVLLRRRDDALLASTYLRTNGNPIQASLNCYRGLQDQIPVRVSIVGLGTTGSGRHIAGLHALTKGVINEIIAHAVAAAYFDEEVDTIFEIGGQDAKYTYLTNGVASDYAMNEACSAGTGSFLEEAAHESLSIDYRDIAAIALEANQPPNFNDQCAAFISSDIKTAAQEGISRENVVGGLVYSICMNFVNRVKGNRAVGKKIFMQGGVCYNRAVPIAMASLLQKDIVVPPEPGLMGAFGVALEVKRRIELGLLEPGSFDLGTLMERVFEYGDSFICAGGEEHCDRKCDIALVHVDGKKYPFGGACNRYYDQRLRTRGRTLGKDYVKIREELVFRKYAGTVPERPNGKSVGMLKSFTTNTLYPLYHHFFTYLGYRVVLSDTVDRRGLDKMHSSFCFPVELSYSFFEHLLTQKVDAIFLPHIQEMSGTGEHVYNRLCVFAQAEPYYLRNAFADASLPPILSPVINFADGFESVENTFVKLGKDLGRSPALARSAFQYGYDQYQAMLCEFKALGREALAEVERDRHHFGIVLFGRQYNAFAKEANLGIPHKFATKDIVIIPHEFLPVEHLPSYENMYWTSGQQIMRGTRFVKEHPKLFGVFITNFSCGPDSFVVSYFRTVMGSKPSLTLELDSHAADVGVNTRIEAALDIILNYLELSRRGLIMDTPKSSALLDVLETTEGIRVRNSSGQLWDLRSPDVEVMIPSMGRFGADSMAAAFRAEGIQSISMPVPTTTTLKYGRNHTNCKECLPFILAAGQMVEHLSTTRGSEKKRLFFMPDGCGPCRQGQYSVKMKDLINERGFQDVGILSLSDENAYGGLGLRWFRKAWLGIMIADLVADVENALKVLASHPASAIETLNNEWQAVVQSLDRGNTLEVFKAVERFAHELSHIPLRMRPQDATVVSLIGEIYVRHDEFSARELLETLIANGFVVRITPVSEYIYYVNYVATMTHNNRTASLADRMVLRGKNAYQWAVERRIRKILSKTGLVSPHMIDVEKTINHARHLVTHDLVGETILTLGLALREIVDESAGVVSIGPFGCMPSRVAEAILSREMTIAGKRRSNGSNGKHYPEGISTLPYLHVETDGNPLPQITQSKIEIFMLQVNKMHKAIKREGLISLWGRGTEASSGPQTMERIGLPSTPVST